MKLIDENLSKIVAKTFKLKFVIFKIIIGEYDNLNNLRVFEIVFKIISNIWKYWQILIKFIFFWVEFKFDNGYEIPVYAQHNLKIGVHFIYRLILNRI